MGVEWLGHASFRWIEDKVIYFDPWKLKTDEKADLIFVSHDHYDHFNRDDIKKISNYQTVVISCQAVADNLPKVRVMSPGEKTVIGGVKIHAVASYNIDKNYHPKRSGYLGFIVEMGGKKVFHAGDCDNIPELAMAKGVDVALVPASGTFVMTAVEAADAVNTSIKPRMAIPMHWGTIVGSEEDAKRFVEGCKFPAEVPKKVA